MLVLSSLFSLIRPSSIARVAQNSTDFAALPSAAQAAISSALGSDRPTYHFQPTADGWRATHRRQGLEANLTDAGAEIHAGDVRLALSLAAFGYGDALQPIAPAQLQANANRVEYYHTLADTTPQFRGDASQSAIRNPQSEIVE